MQNKNITNFIAFECNHYFNVNARGGFDKNLTPRRHMTKRIYKAR